MAVEAATGVSAMMNAALRTDVRQALREIVAANPNVSANEVLNEAKKRDVRFQRQPALAYVKALRRERVVASVTSIRAS